MTNPDLEQYTLQAIERGALHALVIDPKTVVTAPWVRLKCRFGCPLYGKGLCCPPYSPAWEETRAILDSYRHAILLHHRTGKSLDKDLNEIVLDLERALFLDGYYKAFAMGNGPCRLCPECDLAGCRKPSKARPSMESTGIDVFATVRAHGLPIRTVRDRGEDRNYYGLVLVE